MVRAERKFPSHPSGRPRPRDNYRRLGFTRPVREEPLTPGLKRKPMEGPIGFHAAYREWGGVDDEPPYVRI